MAENWIKGAITPAHAGYGCAGNDVKAASLPKMIGKARPKKKAAKRRTK